MQKNSILSEYQNDDTSYETLDAKLIRHALKIDKNEEELNEEKLNKYIEECVKNQNKQLLSEFVKETNVQYKTKRINEVMIKIGHLLRVWLDLS